MSGDDQPDNMASRTRDGKGRFDRDPATVERDAEAARLRGRGWTYQRIGDHLGITRQSARDAVQRAFADTLTEPADEARQRELDRLDDLWEAALKVLERRHVHVSGGKVVTQVTEYVTDEAGNVLLDENHQPRAKTVAELEDDAPVLAAIDRLVKIQARRAALLGLDAEKKIDVGGKLTYEILGVDLNALK